MEERVYTAEPWHSENLQEGVRGNSSTHGPPIANSEGKKISPENGDAGL